MQLSVIILNYNVRYFLELCLESVQAALRTIDSEIIVVDNASTDSSAEMMRTRFPEVQWIPNTSNYGFPKGNNIGVHAAKGNYVCILNPDTVVAEDTFVNILAFAQTQKDLGIIGVKLIDGTGHFLPESKRGVPTPWVALTKMLGCYRWLPKSSWFNQYYAGHLSEDQQGKVSILVGAFMVLSRELYQQMEGFDEGCFMYADDIDLSYRVGLAGKTNWYVPQTTVIHFKGESTLKDETFRLRFQEAMRYFYRKHFNRTWLMEGAMALGARFFSLFKRWQGTATPKNAVKQYELWSRTDKNLEKLRAILGKKVVFESFSDEKLVHSSRFSAAAGTEVILDSASLSFKEIIQCYAFLKDGGVTIKILSPQATFMIGSASSTARGEIIKIM